jgi:predicted DNA-binding transcriptional regulator AlpA
MTTKMLTEKEVAAAINTSLSTLARMKRRGDAPPYIRVGARRLMYPLDALVRWIESRTQ